MDRPAPARARRDTTCRRGARLFLGVPVVRAARRRWPLLRDSRPLRMRALSAAASRELRHAVAPDDDPGVARVLGALPGRGRRGPLLFGVDARAAAARASRARPRAPHHRPAHARLPSRTPAGAAARGSADDRRRWQHQPAEGCAHRARHPCADRARAPRRPRRRDRNARSRRRFAAAARDRSLSARRFGAADRSARHQHDPVPVGVPRDLLLRDRGDDAAADADRGVRSRRARRAAAKLSLSDASAPPSTPPQRSTG